MLRNLNGILTTKFSKTVLRSNTRNLVKLSNNSVCILNNSKLLNTQILNSNCLCSPTTIITSKSSYNTDATTLSSNASSTNASTTGTTTQQESTIKSSASGLIIHHHHEGIVEIQLNLVESKNALSKKLVFELGIVIDSIKSDTRARCIVIRSVIPNIFCAGANLKERMKMSEKEVGPFVSKLRETFHALSKLPIPVICAIDGAALGGGLELALACDIRVAASNAKLGLVETKLAIIPGAGGTQRLPRVVGVSKAKELIFTSKIVDSTEAERIGLVNASVPQNEQNDAAYRKAIEMAQQIIANGPIAIQMAKLAIDSGIQVDIDSALKFEELCYSRVIPTKDRIEGLNSFVEKRPAKYIGE